MLIQIDESRLREIIERRVVELLDQVEARDRGRTELVIQHMSDLCDSFRGISHSNFGPMRRASLFMITAALVQMASAIYVVWKARNG